MNIFANTIIGKVLYYFVSYLRYYFLTSLIAVLSFFWLITVDAIIGLESFSFAWLRYFSWLIPKLDESSFSLNIFDLIILFNVFNIFFIILSLVLKMIIFKNIHTTKVTVFTKWLVGEIIILIFFGAAMLGILAGELDIAGDKKLWCFILSIFVLMGLVSHSLFVVSGWFLNNKIINKILS